MFREYVQQLIKELSLDEAPLPQELDSFTLNMNEVEVKLTSLPPGVLYTAVLGQLPEEQEEEMLTSLLRGNFAGQATRRAYLGLDERGINVVATMMIPQVRGYKEFQDMLEDFGNVTAFWKGELSKNIAPAT